jgi:hypothetical protein
VVGLGSVGFLKGIWDLCCFGEQREFSLFVHAREVLAQRVSVRFGQIFLGNFGFVWFCGIQEQKVFTLFVSAREVLQRQDKGQDRATLTVGATLRVRVEVRTNLIFVGNLGSVLIFEIREQNVFSVFVGAERCLSGKVIVRVRYGRIIVANFEFLCL